MRSAAREAAAITAMANATVHTSRSRRREMAGGAPSWPAESAVASSISIAASPACRRRRARSFCRHRRNSRRIPGGVFAGQRGPIRFLGEDRRYSVGDVLASERMLPSEHFVEHTAERPNVRAPINGLSFRLLRSSCTPRFRESPDAHRHRGRSDGWRIAPRSDLMLRRAISFGQPEVEDLDCAVGAHLDVRGLEIPMDDSLLVCGFEGLRDLSRNRQRLVEWKRTLGDPLASVGPSTNSITRACTPSALQARRSPRCSGGSARRAPWLLVRTARVDPDRARTRPGEP